MFVKVFGMLLGVACLMYGGLVLIYGVDGIGLCRSGCQLNSAILSALGSNAYGFLYGILWIFSGLVFIVFILRVSKRKKEKRRK